MMNDKTKLVKEAKNDKASRCCWSAYQKKIRQNGIRRNAIRRNATQPLEERLGEMKLDEMRQHPVRPSVRPSHGWISQKRCKLGLPNFHHRLPGRL